MEGCALRIFTIATIFQCSPVLTEKYVLWWKSIRWMLQFNWTRAVTRKNIENIARKNDSQHFFGNAYGTVFLVQYAAYHEEGIVESVVTLAAL